MTAYAKICNSRSRFGKTAVTNAKSMIKGHEFAHADCDSLAHVCNPHLTGAGSVH